MTPLSVFFFFNFKKVRLVLLYTSNCRNKIFHDLKLGHNCVPYSSVAHLSWNNLKIAKIALVPHWAPRFWAVLLLHIVVGYILWVRHEGDPPLILLKLNQPLKFPDLLLCLNESIRCLQFRKAELEDLKSSWWGHSGTPSTEEELCLSRSGIHSLPTSSDLIRASLFTTSILSSI